MTAVNQERFWAKVNKTDGCWLWTGAKSEGYGQIMSDGLLRHAHRLLFEATQGPIPPGMQLDHLCRVRACIRPDHLEVVTRRENILRGIGPTAINARRTHCVHGHEFTADNVYITYRKRRACRECRRRDSREQKVKRRLRAQEAKAQS